MRRPIIAFTLIACFCLLFSACAKPTYKRVNPQLSFSEAKTNDRGYIKKAAIVLKSTFGQPAENFFFQNLVTQIRDNSSQLNLSTVQDGELPLFFKTFESTTDDRQLDAVLENARWLGFHCVLVAQLQNIVAEEKKTGAMWFRNTKYFISASVALEVYDTITGTKIFAQLPTETEKVDASRYGDFMEGRLLEIPELNEIFIALAEELGDQAAEAMADHGWMTSVNAVEGGNVRLSADQNSGLRAGDRLSVFEGRRKAVGPDGKIYIIPGYKISEIQVTGFVDKSAEAKVEGQADIQPGDIAIPTSN